MFIRGAIDLKKTNFNIISPVDFVFKLDGQPINFSGKTYKPLLDKKKVRIIFLLASKREDIFSIQGNQDCMFLIKVSIKKLFSQLKKTQAFISRSFNPSLKGNILSMP